MLFEQRQELLLKTSGAINCIALAIGTVAGSTSTLHLDNLLLHMQQKVVEALAASGSSIFHGCQNCLKPRMQSDQLLAEVRERICDLYNCFV